MKTIIVYGSKYGTTEKCAKILAEKLDGQVDLFNLKKEKKRIDLSQYDKVVIGSSVYIGTIRKEVTKFCKDNIDELENKKIGLFICNMAEGDEAQKQLNNVFAEKIYSMADAKAYFGGEISFDKMGLFDSLIVKKVSKTEENVSKILVENINKFALDINKD